MKCDWTGAVWVGCGAVAVGTVVARVIGGALPHGLIEIVVALVAIPALIALVGSIVARRRNAGVHAPRINVMANLNAAHSPWNARTVGATDTMPDDWDALATICSAIPTIRINWLRTNTFSTPWLDANVRDAFDVEQLAAAARQRPFPYQIDDALLRLCDAIAAFRNIYDRSTFPDPVLPGAEWRFFEWDGASSFQMGAPGETPWDDRADEMHRLARAVSDACEDLQTAAATGIVAFRSVPART